MSVVLPIIHMNGTSKERLLDAVDNAYHACNAAIDALKQTAPNGRDYYVGEPGLFEAAIAQHRQRMEAIQSVIDSLSAEAVGISDQGA